MAKELTEQQKLRLRRAKQAAKADGKVWADLTQDQRRQYRKDARVAGPSAAGQVKAATQPNPARQKAVKMARAAGKKWRELSADERTAYLKQARQDS